MLAKELLAKEQPDYKQHKKEIHEEIEKEARRLLTQMGLADRMEIIHISFPADSVSVSQSPEPCVKAGYSLCFDEPTSRLILN